MHVNLLLPQNVWIWWNSVVAFILPTILILVGGFLTALHFARASSVHNDNKYILFQKSVTSDIICAFSAVFGRGGS